jgi:hypothetical protein
MAMMFRVTVARSARRELAQALQFLAYAEIWHSKWPDRPRSALRHVGSQIAQDACGNNHRPTGRMRTVTIGAGWSGSVRSQVAELRFARYRCAPRANQHYVDCCDAHSISEMGHSRRGRADSKPGHVPYAPKAEVNSQHERTRAYESTP